MTAPTPRRMSRAASASSRPSVKGFGAVYLADIRSRSNFEQRLAVKVLNEELGNNEEVVRRQRDEARLLAQG